MDKSTTPHLASTPISSRNGRVPELLASGEWIQKLGHDLLARSISELRATFEAASCVSMFKIRFQLPTYERYHPDPRKAVFTPFYPLPYRDKRGGILFPSSGYGWYMRDDVLAAVAWLERFVPDFPRQTDKHHRMTTFEIEEAWIFRCRDPGGGQRKDPSISSLIISLENAAKLKKRPSVPAGTTFADKDHQTLPELRICNGKLAQSVGGDGDAPSDANPNYAAASTTASMPPSSRRSSLLYRQQIPHAIVFFATDGIVSVTRPLNGLARVRKHGDVGELGDWEYFEADSGLFVMPGVYTYGKVVYDETGARTIKPVTKIRGGDAKKYGAKLKANQWLIENVLTAWRTPF